MLSAALLLAARADVPHAVVHIIDAAQSARKRFKRVGTPRCLTMPSLDLISLDLAENSVVGAGWKFMSNRYSSFGGRWVVAAHDVTAAVAVQAKGPRRKRKPPQVVFLGSYQPRVLAAARDEAQAAVWF
jgi:hypothetical protein